MEGRYTDRRKAKNVVDGAVEIGGELEKVEQIGSIREGK